MRPQNSLRTGNVAPTSRRNVMRQPDTRSEALGSWTKSGGVLGRSVSAIKDLRGINYNKGYNPNGLCINESDRDFFIT